jgi:hypothetical protein
VRLWPFGRRSHITRTRDGLIIVIPAPGNIFILLFLTLWLVAWAAGEAFIPSQIIAGEMRLDGFIAAWFVGWTIAGTLGIYSWLWMLRGKEYVRVTSDVVGIRRSVWSRGVERQFRVADISDLRVQDQDAWHPFREEDPPRYSWREGRLVFDHRGTTVHFGKGLRETEARDVLQEITAVIGDV